MKLYLDSNIVEGTPEELVTYQELLKEKGLTKESEKSLFHFGHAHQPTEEEVQDTFKGFFGSLKLDKSSIGSEESSTEEDDEADVGEFYTVNVENSALAKGTLLKKVDKDTHKDSTGHEYLCVDSNALSHIDKNLYQLEDRFNFAIKVGVRLTDTTDFAQATEGEYFKVIKEYSDLSVGDIVTIARDDRDSMPQCKDKHSNFYYLELHHLELVEGHEDAPMGYTFWYLDDVNFNKFSVLKTSLEGYFETSLGERYTHNAVSDLIKPIDREDVREKFDDAENRGTLLSYYPTIDVFMNSH